MGWDVRGIIEGFYGKPWTWDERVEVMQFCHARGMTHYVYAPKDDPLHREKWRTPYPAAELAGFERLLHEGGLSVGFALSPGLSITYDDADDRAMLAAKVDQVVDLGVDLVCLALDDIPVRPGLGHDHAAITTWLRDHLGDRADLLLVPTEYTGTTSTPYVEALARGVPADVPIAWTGVTVVCDEITSEQARARAASLGDRPPLIWDNYPVNDATMGDHLFVGPLRGRGPDLGEWCSGYLANPMVQPRASCLPLASIAGYLRGDDPERVWADEADALGWRPFAEACDGHRPRTLVANLIDADRDDGRDDDRDDDPDTWPDAWLDHFDGLRDWLEAAEGCVVPDTLRDEVARWVEQVHTEARVGLTAVRVLEGIRPSRHRGDGPRDREATFERALTLAVLWQEVRRSEVTVMGDRLGIRPVFGQDRDGHWVLDRSAITENDNAIDRLARFALDSLTP